MFVFYNTYLLRLAGIRNSFFHFVDQNIFLGDDSIKDCCPNY